MPNYCNNSLKLRHDDPAMIDRAMKAFQEGKLLEEFVPVPTELKETMAGHYGDGYKRELHEFTQQLNIKYFGYANWYDFAVAEWGTKWDVSEPQYTENKDGSVTIWFDTAWAPPMPIYEELEAQGFEVEATYCEQGVGYAGWYADGEDNEHSISFWDDTEDCDDIANMEAFFQDHGLTHSPAHTGG